MMRFTTETGLGNQKAMKKYMVVESYRDGCFEKVYERYHAQGRMLPEGLMYLNSWVNREQRICFQLMETADESLFQEWFKKWEDLVGFELFPVD